MLRAGATTNALGSALGRAVRRGVRGAGACCTGFGTRTVDSFVAVALALVAASRLFDILVGGGEVVANADAPDEERVCGLGGG